MRREPWLSLVAGLILTAIGAVIFWYSDLDIRLQRLAYRASEPHWPYATQQPWMFLRNWGTWPGLLLAVAAIVALASSFTSDRARRWRYPALFIFLLTALGPGLITNLLGKALFGRPRPDEVVQFGGSLPFHRAFQMGQPGKGFSFLCGHCSMGYLFFAFFFLWRGARRWIALVASIAFGLLIGVGRVAQGAHFPSDVLLDGTLMFTIAAALSPIAARQPSPRTLPRWKVATVSAVAIVLTVGAFLFSTPVLKEWTFVWIRSGDEHQRATRQEIYVWRAPKQISVTVDKGDVEVLVRRQREPLIIESVVKGFGFPGATSENVIATSGDVLSFRNRLRGLLWEVHGHFRVWISDEVHVPIVVKTGDGAITRG